VPTAAGLTGGAFASLLSPCSTSAPPINAPTAAAPTSAPAAGATTKPAAGAGTAPAATTAPAASGGRGAGGPLKVLMWQGPTILNTHLSQGTKDSIASRFCCEPLLTVSGDGTFTPVLAAEVPSKENGGLAADGQPGAYKLKSGIQAR